MTYDRSGLIDLLSRFSLHRNSLNFTRSILSTVKLGGQYSFTSLLSLKYTLPLMSEVFFEPIFKFEKKEDQEKIPTS